MLTISKVQRSRTETGITVSGLILGLFVPSITLILALAFAALWLRAPSAFHVLAFAGCYALVGSGFLVFHYLSAPTHIPSMLLAHGCYAGAALLMFWGIYRRVGKRAPLKWFAAIQIGCGLAMSLTVATDDMRAWLYSANLGHGLIFALAANDLLRDGWRTSLDRVIGWIVAMCSAMFLTRPVMSIMVEQRMTVEVYKSSDFYALLMITVGVLTLALAMALVAAVLHDQMASMQEESENDHLTGLKMRRPFEQAAMNLIDRGTRQDKAVSMIVADIDHFKQVNDLWGHQAGDRAIADFGALIERTVRAGDICGRIGGEEFCIIVWNCELGPAERLAERIRAAFAKMPHDGISSDVRLTASFGVATCRPQEGFGKLFARADAALYRAKEAGRNKVISDRREEKRSPSSAPVKDQIKAA